MTYNPFGSRAPLARASRFLFALTLATGTLALAPRSARAEAWAFADIAQDGGSPSSVVWSNATHAFWIKNTSQIVHSYVSGGSWVNDTLVSIIDGSSFFHGPTAVVLNNKTYVFFYSSEFHTFCYLVSTGSAPSGGTWDFHVLDGSGSESDGVPKTGNTNHNVGYWSAAVVWNGKLYVTYLDSTTGALRVGQYNPTTNSWALQVLDGGPTGQSTHTMTGRPTLAIFTGIPEAFYYDSTAGDFRGAWTFDGSSWGTMIMDGEGGGNGRNYGHPGYYSAAVVWNNQPNLFYWDQSNGGMLRRAYYDGSWHMSTLDGASGTAYGAISSNVGPSVTAVLNNGSPEVFYYDQTNGNLRELYYWNGLFSPGWYAWTMDGDGGPNNQVNLPASGHVGIDVNAVSLNGVPQVFYSWVPSPGNQTFTYAYPY